MDCRVHNRFSLLAFACLLSVTTSAFGVAVSTSTGNTSRPTDDPGWSHVGIRNGSTAVYLGNQWVLTAAHVGAGPTTFPEFGTFGIIPGSPTAVRNPSNIGMSQNTDLVLYQIDEPLDLPQLVVSSAAPPVGAEVVFIGNGRDRADDITHWNVFGSVFQPVWHETDQPSNRSGFKTVGANSLRWGTNIIEDDEPFFYESDEDHTTRIGGRTDVVALVTEFDMPGGDSSTQPSTLFESQAVVNDSGGAMFYKNGNGWELSGIIIAVDGFNNQPNVTVNPVFGNLTLSADLATYEDQITSRYWVDEGTQPSSTDTSNAYWLDEAKRGDFDGDALLTDADIDLLSDAIAREIVHWSLDLNFDGRVTAEDREVLIAELMHTGYGDSNLDGIFDSSDLVAVFKADVYDDNIRDNADWTSGDWNGDGEFDSGDLTLAFKSAGYSDVAATKFAAHVVPEPTGLASLLLVLPLLGRFRRRSVDA